MWTGRLTDARQLEVLALAIRRVLEQRSRAPWSDVRGALQEQDLLSGPAADLLDRLRHLDHDEVAAVRRRLPSGARTLLLAPADDPLRDRLADEDLMLDADLDRVVDQAGWGPLPVTSPDAIVEGVVPLGRAWMQASQVKAELTAAAGAPEAWHLVGGLRRSDPMTPDVAVLAVTDDPQAWIGRAVAALHADTIAVAGSCGLAIAADPEPVVVHAVRQDAVPTSLLWYTGPRAHVQEMRLQSAARGLALNRYSLLGADGPLALTEEADVYRHLDLPVIPVELRGRRGVIESAREGTLPELIEMHDIQGDLHMHTVYSDGRDSVAGMVHAARALGYRYVAITDHSPSAKASRVLTLDRVEQQAEEIAAVRALVPDVTILHGIECDILPDGHLDVPDDVLERLDVVLASLHDGAGHGPERLLERYLTVMRHPLVNVITHPANRSPGRTPGYVLAFARLFEYAARTGTAIEIDGAPGHLDLDAPLAEQAASIGAMLVINSDCHVAERLGRQMQFGVALARRAALTAGQVLNTRDVDGVRRFVAAKRTGRV